MTSRLVKLGEVILIDRKSVLPSEIQEETFYVGLENITGEGNFLEVPKINVDGVSSNKFKFDSSHVLYGKLRPYLKKIAAPDFSGICSTDILPIKPLKNLDRKYLLHYLRQQKMVDFANSKTTGANLPRLSPNQLLEFEIPLPPLEVQKRIASILDAADALRAKRRESLRKLEVLLKSVFLEMFGDPVTNPKGWEVKKLSELAIFENGDRSSNYPSGDDIQDSGIPFLSTKNIVNNQFKSTELVFISAEKFKSLSRGKLKQNDLIITLRGTLGSCCIFESTNFETGFINAQMMIIRCKSDVSNQYLHSFLTSIYMENWYRTFSTGAAVPQLTATQLSDLRIPLPSMEAQKKFEKLQQLLLAKQEKYRQSLASLETLFSSLQDQAFNGTLDSTAPQLAQLEVQTSLF
jgi:type I restriction enzyme, S subunit